MCIDICIKKKRNRKQKELEQELEEMAESRAAPRSVAAAAGSHNMGDERDTTPDLDQRDSPIQTSALTTYRTSSFNRHCSTLPTTTLQQVTSVSSDAPFI